jgi:hypothetical protein
MHLSEDQIADLLGLIAACVVMPICVCAVARLSLFFMPGSLRAQVNMYLAMTFAFPLLFLTIELIAWLCDKVGVSNTQTPLWFVFGGAFWVALMFGAPYLYLRRRLMRDKKNEPQLDNKLDDFWDNRKQGS